MIRLFFILAFLTVCILFALANQTPVTITLGFYTASPIAVGLLLMTTAFIGVVFGFYLALFGQIRHRYRAFRAERKLGSVVKKKEREDKKREKAQMDLLMSNPFKEQKAETKSVFSRFSPKLSKPETKQITSDTEDK